MSTEARRLPPKDRHSYCATHCSCSLSPRHCDLPPFVSTDSAPSLLTYVSLFFAATADHLPPYISPSSHPCVKVCPAGPTMAVVPTTSALTPLACHHRDYPHSLTSTHPFANKHFRQRGSGASLCGEGETVASFSGTSAEGESEPLSPDYICDIYLIISGQYRGRDDSHEGHVVKTTTQHWCDTATSASHNTL